MNPTVEKVTYARVAKGATPKNAYLRPHDPALDDFLLRHVDALRKFSNGKLASPAFFKNSSDRASFESIRDGDDQEFLLAASAITLQLIAEMNGSTAEGLLVCVQFNDGHAPGAAVLKLQVVAPNAANLKTLDSGEQVLSAVTDVMDAPGKLQKGALIDDSRPGSDVVVGDLASIDAQYFPRALGIAVQERPKQAAIELLTAVRDLHGPETEVQVRKLLPSLSSETVVDVLEELGPLVSDLKPKAARDAVQSRLEDRPRPVRSVQTSAPLNEIITASDITIKVPLTSQDRVTIEQDKLNGGYQIHIRVDEEPKREVR